MVTPEDEEFERIMHEQKRLAEWAPKGPPKKPWSQQTIEERLDNAISIWEKNLARVDHDGTALTHDTWVNDPERYCIAADYRVFVHTLHAIKDRT